MQLKYSIPELSSFKVFIRHSLQRFKENIYFYLKTINIFLKIKT